jgi:hypothetical protein
MKTRGRLARNRAAGGSRIRESEGFPPIVSSSDLIPGHRVTPSIRAQPIESQPIEITQLFSSQAVRVNRVASSIHRGASAQPQLPAALAGESPSGSGQLRSTVVPEEAKVGTLGAPSSDQKIAASEILNGQQDAFQVVPPDHRRDVVCSLPHGRRDLPERRQAVIIIQRGAIITAHAVCHQRRMIAIQQRPLELAPAVCIDGPRLCPGPCLRDPRYCGLCQISPHLTTGRRRQARL